MAADMKEAVYVFTIKADQLVLNVSQTVLIDGLMVKSARREELTAAESLVLAMFSQAVGGNR